jgi:Fe-S oxidoreductase
MTGLRSYLDVEREHFLTGCTACGDCFRVCPIVPLTPLKSAGAEEVVTGVLAVLRGEAAPGEAAAWAQACTRCGQCIERCPEGVNPRKMLAITEGLAQEATGAASGAQFFRLMSQNIRLMSGIQLERGHIADIQAPPEAEADVVFYLGCNLLSNPHIILNVMDLLSALGIDHRVAGGTGYCCGVVHFIGGELDNAGKVGENLFSKLAAFRPKTVLTWCPSCEMYLGETVAGFPKHDFELQHLTDFLVARLDALQERMSTPVRRRVALHSHGGLDHITRNVRRLLAAIPGLDVVDIEDGSELGYSCNVAGLARVPSLQAEVLSNALAQAKAAGAEEVVDLYHGCHRMLWDGKDGLRVRNFTDLLVESLGLPGHEDRFEQYRGMDGPEQVLAAARDLMQENGIDAADMESVTRGLFPG